MRLLTLDFIDTVLISFFVKPKLTKQNNNNNKQSHLGKRETQLRKCLHQIGLSASEWVIFLVNE